MTIPHNLLVVDDDTAMRQMLVSLFGERGYEVAESGTADDAIEQASDREFDVVLSDIKMPGRSGIELVGELRRIRPDTPVVLMTAFGTIDSAVEAMRAGAFDYITKPFELEAVMLTVDGHGRHAHLFSARRRRRMVSPGRTRAPAGGSVPKMSPTPTGRTRRPSA